MQFLFGFLILVGAQGFLASTFCLAGETPAPSSGAFCADSLGGNELRRFIAKNYVVDALSIPEFFRETRILVVEGFEDVAPKPEMESAERLFLMQAHPALRDWNPKMFLWRDLAPALARGNLNSEIWFSLMREDMVMFFIDHRDQYQTFALFTDIVKSRFLSGKSTLLLGRPGLEGLTLQLALSAWFDSSLSFTTMQSL